MLRGALGIRPQGQTIRYLCQQNPLEHSLPTRQPGAHIGQTCSTF
jgi:hypothetical protein